MLSLLTLELHNINWSVSQTRIHVVLHLIEQENGYSPMVQLYLRWEPIQHSSTATEVLVDKSTYTVSVMMSLLQLEDSVVEYLMLLVSLVQSVLMLVSLVFNQFCYHNYQYACDYFSQFSTCTDHYK